MLLGRGSLLTTFFAPLVLVLVAALLIVTSFSGRTMRNLFVQHTADELESTAQVASEMFRQPVANKDFAEAQRLCEEIGRRSGMRITVILANGEVIGDSDEVPDLMDNHRDRPEVSMALIEGVGRSTRFSTTLDHQRMYLAVRREIDAGAFVIRTSVSMESLSAVMADLYQQIAFAALILLILSALTSLMLSRNLSRSLKQLEIGAKSIAAGEFKGWPEISGTTEIALVANSLNQMADQLRERFDIIKDQRNQNEAMLASMVEGVLAVDRNENVFSLNEAGAKLLGCELDNYHGRSIQDLANSTEVTRLVQEVLQGDGPIECDITLGGNRDRSLQVTATTVSDEASSPAGVLLVMNDVTRLRRLENMRRDFVANVSHELKTPITSIKGFVEAILDEPPNDPQDLQRFLEIINKQTGRLDAIISDLLILSRIEQEFGGGLLETEPLSLQFFVENVLEEWDTERPQMSGRFVLKESPDISCSANSTLLGQALNNLLSNAIKYSDADSEVTIGWTIEGSELKIEVADFGVGLATEDLPRVFERFYRVDKARSRKMGGTGLGLAIVKHIAQAHGGGVSVKSTLGVGSTFTIHLPWRKEIS